MAIGSDQFAVYLNLDTEHIPPTTIQYLKEEDQYPRSRTNRNKSKHAKSSNGLVKRKPRRSRTVFTKDQLSELTNYFMQNKYIKSETVHMLAEKLSIPIVTVKIWFKNQRHKMKLREMADIKELSVQKTNIKVPKKRSHPLNLPTLYDEPLTSSSPLMLAEIPSVLLTPPPSDADVNLKFTFDTNNQDCSAYNSNQDKELDFRIDEPFELRYETAYQWLNNLPTTTTPRMMTNNTSSHLYIPHKHSFHDSLTDCNRSSYTLPSPDSTINSDTSDHYSQLSVDSEIMEPLTPNSIHRQSESVFSDILDSLKTLNTKPPIDIVFDEFSVPLAPEINR